MPSSLPFVIEANELAEHLNDDNLLILDLSSADHYAAGHIPGAIHVESSRMLCGQAPVPNKIPTVEQRNALFSSLGLTPETHVVVYDDQMGPWAGRMIWTLHASGHNNVSFLNGQLEAWAEAELPLETEANQPTPSHFEITPNDSVIADVDFILAHLKDPNFRVWDARTAAEYEGTKITNARRGGHIPGAQWLEWTDTLNSGAVRRLRNPEAIRSTLANANLNEDNLIVTHCQTHRRSGLTYVVAHWLGFKNVRCYDGSWFEWGNRDELPVESEHFKSDEG